jgi:hypothetical protein
VLYVGSTKKYFDAGPEGPELEDNRKKYLAMQLTLEEELIRRASPRHTFRGTEDRGLTGRERSH